MRGTAALLPPPPSGVPNRPQSCCACRNPLPGSPGSLSRVSQREQNLIYLALRKGNAGFSFPALFQETNGHITKTRGRCFRSQNSNCKTVRKVVFDTKKSTATELIWLLSIHHAGQEPGGLSWLWLDIELGGRRWQPLGRLSCQSPHGGHVNY